MQNVRFARVSGGWRADRSIDTPAPFLLNPSTSRSVRANGAVSPRHHLCNQKNVVKFLLRG